MKQKKSRVKGTIKRSLTKVGNDCVNVKFYFYAPLATQVDVAGSFSNWERIHLNKDKDGNWTLEKELAKAKYEYKYVIDGKWENAQGDTLTVDNGMGERNNLMDLT